MSSGTNQSDVKYELFSIADKESRTTIFLFEYVGNRRGIFYVNGVGLGSIAIAYGLETAVGEQETPQGTHLLFVASNKVYFKSKWNGTIRWKVLKTL